MSEWVVEESVRSVVCPVCAFTFDAIHGDGGDDYTCPACDAINLERQLKSLRKLSGGQSEDVAHAYLMLRAVKSAADECGVACYVHTVLKEQEPR